eukprot:2753116-Prymnesium_polylepis.1
MSPRGRAAGSKRSTCADAADRVVASRRCAACKEALRSPDQRLPQHPIDRGRVADRRRRAISAHGPPGACRQQ